MLEVQDTLILTSGIALAGTIYPENMYYLPGLGHLNEMLFL